MIKNKVFASTGAEKFKSGDNIEIGITAHCKCGNVFTDNIKACNTHSGRISIKLYDKYGFPLETFLNRPFKSFIRIFFQLLRNNLRIKITK